MCGILGIIGLNSHAQIEEALSIAMGDTMVHRGPDGDGFLFAGTFDLDKVNKLTNGRKNTQVFSTPRNYPMMWAQKRLSIIDLDNSAGQPMRDTENKVWVNFNGEIYNHAEIRTILEQDGFKFRTSHSDTEVILNAYKKWGIQCIHQFRGMFAIALWDIEKDEFFFVRDRLGVKPFYYTIQNDKFYFASEIKAIIEDKKVVRKVNYRGVYDYLTFLTVPAPETLFDGIYKLKPGHYMHLKNGELSPQIQYWDVFDNVTMSTESESQITERLLYELEESVKYRTIADVPVGVFLSGGVDSSTNAALFSKISKHRVKAFAIGYKDDASLKSHKNEFVYARQIAKQFNLDYYEQELTQEDFLDFLPKMIHHQDEPIADPVCMPVYFVSKLAKENGVTVAQVGEGSDELFWGYKYFKQVLELEKLNALPIPNLLKKASLKAMELVGKDNTVAHELLRRGTIGKPLFWGGITSFGEKEKLNLLSGEVSNVIKNYSTWDSIEPYYKKYLSTAPEQHPANWMSYFDLKVRIPELLLMRVDKMGMAVSLEGRVPFLDYKFVEYAMSIPAALKVKNNESKYILKKAVEGLLPNDIIYRKKQGFGVPVYDWFFKEFGTQAKSDILKFTNDTGYFSKPDIEDIFNQNNGTKAWYLYNLALWHKQYIGS